MNETPKKEINWVTIALIGGAIWFFTQQKGCDLSNILPKSNPKVVATEIQEPSAQYKNQELENFKLEAAKNPKKAAFLAAFYYAFADILSRNPNFITTNSEFRTYQSKALDLALKSNSELSSPALGDEIEAYLQKYISLNPVQLDQNTTKNCLLALAWAANNAN